MISVLKVSSFLLLLTTLIWSIKTDTVLFTDSDAEEEEKKISHALHGNETFSHTTELPGEDSSLEPILEDRLDSKKENIWWEGTDTNLTDYDELHGVKKNDASPENSVDRDLLENVNYFLPDQSGTDASQNIDFHPEDSSQAKSFLLSNETFVRILPDQSIKISSERTTCGFGDRKCNTLATESPSDLSSKYPDEVVHPTVIPFSVAPRVDILDTPKWSENASLVMSDGSTSVKALTDYATLTPLESTTAQTSDNLILVEGSETGKDESVINGQLNKSDKSRQALKQRDGLSDITDEMLARTFLKTTEMTPLILPEKDSISVVNTPSFPSTLLTKLLSTSSPNFEISVHLKPIQISTTVSPVPHKTNTDIFPESPVLKKESENESNVELMSNLEFYTSASNPYSTVSSYNSKSNSPLDNGKEPKQGKNFDIIVLTPSFSESPTSSETDVFADQKSSFSRISQESNSKFLQIASSLIPLTITPVLKPVTVPSIPDKDPTTTTIHNNKGDDIEETVPPPRLTNPGCSSLPVCVEVTLLETTWEQFCNQKREFQTFLSKSVSHYTRPIHPYHIVLDTDICAHGSALRSPQNTPDVTVAFYVTNDSGEYEERMTEIVGVILRKWAPSSFKSSVLEVRLYNSESLSTPLPIIPELNSGFVAAVSISAVAGVALCLLCIMLVVMKQKLMQGRNSDTTTPTADAYSLDSLSISASFRRRRIRRSARSYLNHAFNDQEVPSHPLTEKTLTNCLKSKDLLEEEYRRIPMTMPKLDSIPEGAHAKNRYSNILPKAESRVVLADPSGDPLKCYINANFVKGYEGKSAYYIACQAPLPEGIEDFWRMVWEQQSRVIVMLTMFEENGTSRCAIYFPQSTLISQQPFGDFQVSLLKKDVYEFYTVSTLRLLDLEKNLFRDIVHLWFTGWPDVGVPKDPSSLVTFVQQCRPFINCNSGPTIVHCSTGTGRTGVFLALDVCMREYEESRSVDILQCVAQLRRDRAGAVQNKDQYFLVHEAILEYMSRMINQTQRPSVCS